MLFALIFAAQGDPTISQFEAKRPDLKPGPNKLKISTATGELSGVIEMPEEEPRAFALFAHCFTCGKDFLPEARITRGLAKRGIATLRIDFAGLGASEGEFQDTSFVTNLEDLVEASDWLKEHFEAPKLLVGHSLGGAAVLAAAGEIESVRAIVTIGAPADPQHVTHLFEDHIDDIETHGEADVSLGGRTFTIGNKFLNDLKDFDHEEELRNLRGIEVLILHAPKDETVALENAGKIFSALKHPKSFVALSNANHLLTNPKDAAYVAELIEVWARRVIVD